MLSAASKDTRFRLTAGQAEELVERFGTPLYVIDEAHLRQTIRRYLKAFRSAYSDSQIYFASKANSTLAVLKIAYDEGCGIDVASEGELRAAMAAGVPASACHLHGNNKTAEEIGFAIAVGVSQIVVDNFEEIETISDLTGKAPDIVLRLAPGVDPVTHHKISTGQADTKFGFNIADGSAEKATRRCLELGLPLIGFHCHVGSQLLDPEAQRSGGELIAKFAVSIADQTGFKATYLNVGGGLGVKYTNEEDPTSVEEYCHLIVQSVTKALEGSGLHPTLAQEPGRSLISESGVTLYRVGVIKTVPAKEIGTRTYVSVDGGLSDNPRPALYGAKYEIQSFNSPAATQKVTVSGKHCESDKLFEDVELPINLQPGDLVQVLSTGAYNSSMASNYNRYQRPATALIRESGSYDLIQRRETFDEMLAREIVPEDLR
jgi:diaminopimelate decarboxylase